jgi:hypothetical protein
LHVNFAVADTKQWEQSATYLIDTNPAVTAFVKNAGLGFAISYFHDGQPHDFEPDFIIRLKGSEGLITRPPQWHTFAVPLSSTIQFRFWTRPGCEKSGRLVTIRAP